MLIAGAGGHAKEILNIISERYDVIKLLDTINSTHSVFNYGVLHTFQEVETFFQNDNQFCLGVGNPLVRKMFYDELCNLGGSNTTIVCRTALISKMDVEINEGVNLMNYCVIHPSVKIGKGTLINSHSEVHHDSTIGDFCEISPGVQILGSVIVHDFCTIGSGAILLPGIEIGERSIIGAGAVVTKSILPNSKVKGIPAR